MRLRLALPLGVALFAALAAAPAVRAQDAPAQRVVLTDGRVLVGTVVRNGDGTITVTDASGVRTVVPADRVRTQTTMARGAFAQRDPSASRLFIAPTARVIPGGQKRISTFTIMPSFGVGIADRADVSVYATIPVVEGGFVGANAKVSLLQTPGAAVSVGASAGTAYGFDSSDTPFGGTAYLLGTLGNDARSVTAGVFGLYGGSLGDDVSVGDGFGLLLGGDLQVSNRVKLITENMVAIPTGSGNAGTASYHLAGARFFSGGVAGDLALAAVNGDGEFHLIPFPYFGFSYTF